MMRPPYIDPDTNIIYDIDNPEYEGWLTKQSMWLKVWMDGWMDGCFLVGISFILLLLLTLDYIYLYFRNGDVGILFSRGTSYFFARMHFRVRTG
jgi:hypothetical protein